MSRFKVNPETLEILDELRKSLPDHIEDNRKQDGISIFFKAEVAKVSLTSRLLDLVTGTILLAEREHYVPAIVLTRACLETAAALYNLNTKLLNFMESGDESSFEESIDKIAVGTRDEKTPIDAVNILTIIDKLDKDFPNMRKIYDQLSEYAHPNWAGALGSYLKIENNKLGFKVDSIGEILEKDLSPGLSISIAIGGLVGRRIGENLKNIQTGTQQENEHHHRHPYK
jgi:hypothetical protein